MDIESQTDEDINDLYYKLIDSNDTITYKLRIVYLYIYFSAVIILMLSLFTMTNFALLPPNNLSHKIENKINDKMDDMIEYIKFTKIPENTYENKLLPINTTLNLVNTMSLLHGLVNHKDGYNCRRVFYMKNNEVIYSYVDEKYGELSFQNNIFEVKDCSFHNLSCINFKRISFNKSIENLSKIILDIKHYNFTTSHKNMLYSCNV